MASNEVIPLHDADSVSEALRSLMIAVKPLCIKGVNMRGIAKSISLYGVEASWLRNEA